MIRTVPSQNQTTGKERNNAHNLGNAEEQDYVKEEDGAQVMMDVKVLHFLIKLLAFFQIIERIFGVSIEYI